jgi:3-hydroxyisobutyrate dehydrogenase
VADLSQPSIGFIGIGAMGRPMAGHLVKAGCDVTVYDANIDRATAFSHEVGGKAASVAADLWSCDVIITMLPNSNIVEDVLFGAGAVAEGMRPGSIVIEMSSGAPQKTVAMGGKLEQAGIGMIDAPVSGGVSRAVTGDLAIMVGGDPELVALCRPILEKMGSTIVHTGSLGSAHAMKALNNLVSAAGFLAGVEALLIGKQFGLDPDVMTDVLNASSGMNNSTKTKFKRFVLSRSFASGFSADLMVKDLKTALSLARDLGVEAPFSRQCEALWEAGRALLGPGADHTALAEACEKVAGVSLEAGTTGMQAGGPQGGRA